MNYNFYYSVVLQYCSSCLSCQQCSGDFPRPFVAPDHPALITHYLMAGTLHCSTALQLKYSAVELQCSAVQYSAGCFLTVQCSVRIVHPGPYLYYQIGAKITQRINYRTAMMLK